MVSWKIGYVKSNIAIANPEQTMYTPIIALARKGTGTGSEGLAGSVVGLSIPGHKEHDQ
jgi:hypothetical protein